MDRKEFLAQVAKIRKESFKIKDVTLKAGILSTDIYKIEGGKYNITMSKLMNYLSSLNCVIKIETHGVIFLLHDINDIYKFFLNIRKAHQISANKLSEAISVSKKTVIDTELQKTVPKIDTFLKYVEFFNVKMVLEQLRKADKSVQTESSEQDDIAQNE